MRHPLALIVLVGCWPFGGGRGDGDTTPDDSDVDTDTDVDADSDADSDVDIPGAIVFKTSGAWSGDLVAAVGDGPPAGAADTLCQLSAEGGGLEGTFKAWISTETVDAIDRIANTGPWYTTAGDQVFLNASALIGAPATSIEYDERGDVNVDAAWTGTTSSGRWSGVDCFAWQHGFLNAEGTVGNGYGANWSDIQDRDCDETRPLICFEQ